jgi:3-methylcrotonyl-CoA carboxylase alpha subunit
MAGPVVTRLADGRYLVEGADGDRAIVDVAGPRGDRWAACDGAVFHAGRAGADKPDGRDGTDPAPRRQMEPSLTSPMPATVVKVLARPGAAVQAGDTLVVLEAMKMELAIRAPAEAVVTAVHCREGDLVSPDTPLVELE